MTIQFQKAERSQVKLKIGIQGPSGSGKTLGALSIATQIAPNGKIALADTENGSASLYSDRFNFDTISITPPYVTTKYLDVMRAAAEAGYDVLILDSLSHQWAGEGGILARKEQTDARGGNSFTNWAKFTPEHESFKAAILNSPIHIIGTLRAKQEYVVEENGKGKAAPKKMGMAAIQREGMEYELDINFEVQMDHKAITSKDRTGLFPNNVMIDLTDGSVGKKLSDWLKGAKAPEPATPEQIATILSFAKDEDEEKKMLAKCTGISKSAAAERIRLLEERAAGTPA